jgi:hypothetical protein
VGSQLRLIFISTLAVLGAMASASTAAAAPDFTQDVKFFHQSGGPSRPQPAEIAIILGGEAIGKMVPGIRGAGKHFAIIHVKGGRVAVVRQTGPNARVSLDMTAICRANPTAHYHVRATARIAGKFRRAYSRGDDCSYVNHVVERNGRAITRTTFIFEN